MKRKLTVIFLAAVLALAVLPSQVAIASPDPATLTVNFPGISSVHVYVRADDGIDNSATGGLVTSKSYQTDSAALIVGDGTYDVVVVQNAKNKIIDAVVVSGDTTVSGIVSTLTVNFPGISSVHVYVRVDDDISGSATGGLVTSKSYQTDSATFVLLTNIYDVVVVKPGPVTEILDGVLVIALDIKPGSYPNSINPKAKGVIPVAILGHDGFDVTTVDVSSITFGKTGTEASPIHDLTDPLVLADHLKDVNGDGDIDLVLHFNTQDTNIQPGDTVAHLTFVITGYGSVTLSDTIQTVGK